MNNILRIHDALHGVGITPTTPFTNDLAKVDRAALRANLEYLAEQGVGLVYPAGNTGEVMSLSPDEWQTVLETTIEVIGDQAAVVPGVGHELPVALEMARRARSLGADGLLVMPRSQPYVSSEGLIAYWRAIIDAAELPVVVYKRGYPDDGHLLELLGEDSVVGCKYAGRDVSSFAQAVEAQPSAAVWICGTAERYAPFFWSAGARGFTSGLANLTPGLAFELYAALVEGDQGRALDVRSRCLPFEEIRARHDDAFNVGAVKTAMDAFGLAGGKVRPPLRDLDPDTVSEVREVVRQMMKMG